MSELKIALVHDHLLEFGGAERVFVALKKVFPNADLYTAFIDRNRLGIHNKHLEDWTIHTSWADRVPGFKRLFSPLRFLWPLIWESFDFSQYDVVISSSGTMMSKGIITKPKTVHISYLHHPPRNLYYYETAIEWQKFLPLRVYGHLVNHGLRMWDYLSSHRVDHFIANAKETQRRISKFYRMESTVIYPPVVIPESYEVKEDRDYYVTSSRLAKAKHIDVLIKASNKHGFKLKIIGSGRDEEYLRSISSPNVEFLGGVTDEELRNTLAGAKGYLFASVSDEFGIAPVEAMGYGVPVIAFASGGLKETVKDGKNGYLYTELNEGSLIEKIIMFEKLLPEDYRKMADTARKEAEQYSFEEFKKQMLAFVEKHARTA
jgi:glycosyltransferase involved in cell wall biosynthesis